MLCGGGAVWRLVSCLAAAAAVDCSGSGSGWEETGERQRSESRRPAPGSLALAGGMRPHRHTGTGDMSWLGITSPRPPINKLKISLSSGGGGESAVSIFTVYRATVCAVCWPGCCVNIECPCSVNNLVANVRMTRRPILHPSRHGWLRPAAAEIRLELAIIARLLAKHNSQSSLLDGMRMCTELHRYTELQNYVESYTVL